MMPMPSVRQEVYSASSSCCLPCAGQYDAAQIECALASSSGQFAAGYNVYVAAYLSLSDTPTYFQLDSGNNWGPLQWPMAEYLRGVALSTQDDVVTAQILQNTDLTGLSGAEILVGYGTDAEEMLQSNRYRKIFTVPSQ